jgi:tripartite-type tricarboxylate transporter receptor subunit TctC
MNRLLMIAGAALSAAWLAGMAGGAVADVYPSKPIRLIVPFPAGGPTDIVARPLAHQLSEILGKQVIVENVGGAGGVIGASTVARSAPDGYTLLMGTVGTNAINATLYKKLTYDPVKDFASVALVASAPILLVAHPSVPAASLKDLIALVKAKPGELSYGSAGNGTPGHLAGQLFKNMAQVEILHIPYKGSAPAITDLLGGQIRLMFDPIQSPLPYVKAGKLRALGVSSPGRSPLLPDVPAMAEAVPGYEALAWWGVLAPAGTPKEIVAKLNAEILKTVNMPFMKERLSQIGAEPLGSTPEQFDTHIKAEIGKWGALVRASGASVD